MYSEFCNSSASLTLQQSYGKFRHVIMYSVLACLSPCVSVFACLLSWFCTERSTKHFCKLIAKDQSSLKVHFDTYIRYKSARLHRNRMSDMNLDLADVHVALQESSAEGRYTTLNTGILQTQYKNFVTISYGAPDMVYFLVGSH